MLNYEGKVIEYKSLNYQQKKDKLISILSLLKNDLEIFDELYNLISNFDVSEDLLIDVYKIVINLLLNLDNKSIKEYEGYKKIINDIKDLESNDELSDIEGLLKLL
nr:hypothetical protein [Candidatus Gracilibacteria bacterium]